MLKTTSMPLMLVIFLGCATEEAAPPLEGAKGTFTVVTQTPTEFEYVYEDVGQLRAHTIETAPGVVEVTFDFGTTKIVYKIDYNRGIGDFIPSGQPLDAAHTRLIEGSFAQLEDHTSMADENARTLAENALFRQANFMTIVPIGEELTKLSFKTENGWTHISCTCGNQNIGGYTRQAGKGCSCNGAGNGCTGRCGQGCGGTSTPRCWGSTAYTQDCAKHDYGLGSWWAASDDYAGASNNCSCGGACY